MSLTRKYQSAHPLRLGSPLGRAVEGSRGDPPMGPVTPRVEEEGTCCLAPWQVHERLTSVRVCLGAPPAGPGVPRPMAAVAQPSTQSTFTTLTGATSLVNLQRALLLEKGRHGGSRGNAGQVLAEDTYLAASPPCQSA